MLKGALQVFILPMIIAVFVGYLLSIAAYQSRAKFTVLSIFFVILILLTLATLYVSYTCEELGCIAAGFFLIAVFVITVPFSASIPVFFQELPVAFSLILVVIISALIPTIASVKSITTRNAQKAGAKREQVIIKESGMPLYDSNYGTFANKKMIFNMTNDNRNNKTLKPYRSVNGIDFSWLSYEGWWLDNQRGFRNNQDDELDIRELKPVKNFSDTELFSHDLAELKRYQQFEGPSYNIQLEEMKINDYPAINILEQNNLDKELRIYRNGIIIQIRVIPAGEQMGSYPKKDLIKLAESLYATNP